MLLAKADHASGLLRQAILKLCFLGWIASIQFVFAFVFNFSAIKKAFLLKKKEGKKIYLNLRLETKKV